MKGFQQHIDYKIPYIFLTINSIQLSVAFIFRLNFGKDNMFEVSHPTFHPHFDFIFKYLTHLGDGITAYLIAIFLILFVGKKHGIATISALLVSSGIVQYFKNFIFEGAPRPAEYFKDTPDKIIAVKDVVLHHFNSFPSGHSTTAFTLACCIAFKYEKKISQILLLISALIVAFTRVYLGQHFPDDIMAGAIIGDLTALTVFYIAISQNWLKNDKPFISK